MHNTSKWSATWSLARGCTLPCARFSSFCSHFSLGSSQWQPAFTAQLTYAACLHPAGVSHPRRAYLSFACSFRISWQIKHLLFYQLWFILNSPRLLTVGSCLRAVRENQGHLQWNLPSLELVTDPPNPPPPPPVRFPLLLWMCKCVSRACLTLFFFFFKKWWNHKVQMLSLFFI